MAFRKTALEAIGGFDERFRVAGDDVDVCWRLQESGRTLGFSAGAVVMHRRRDSVRRYLQAAVRLRQGRGAARAQVAEPLQPRRLLALVGADLRVRRRRRPPAAGDGALRDLGQRPLPVDLRARPGHARESRCSPRVPAADRRRSACVSALGVALAAAAARALPPSSSAARRDRLASAGQRLAAPTGRSRPLTTRDAPAPRADRARSSCCSRSPGWPAGSATASRPGAGASAPALAWPRPRTVEVWSEAWRDPQAVVQRLQDALAARGGFVRSGGPFDRWDLDLRAGPLGRGQDPHRGRGARIAAGSCCGRGSGRGPPPGRSWSPWLSPPSALFLAEDATTGSASRSARRSCSSSCLATRGDRHSDEPGAFGARARWKCRRLGAGQRRQTVRVRGASRRGEALPPAGARCSAQCPPQPTSTVSEYRLRSAAEMEERDEPRARPGEDEAARRFRGLGREARKRPAPGSSGRRCRGRAPTSRPTAGP